MREDTELDAEQAAVQSRAEGCLLGQCAGAMCSAAWSSSNLLSTYATSSRAACTP